MKRIKILALLISFFAVDTVAESVNGKRLASVVGEREISSRTPIRASALSRRKNSNTCNLSAGVNLIYPMITFQLAVDRELAFGLSGAYYDISTLGVKSQLLGGTVSIHYYSQSMYQGLWIQGGFGLYHASTHFEGVSTRHLGYSVQSTIGYRFSLGSVNFGLAGGGQWMGLQKTTDFPHTFSLWAPAVLGDIGISF